MKRVLVFLLSLFFVNAMAQTSEDKKAMEMYDRGLDYYNKGNLDSTIIIWTEIVEKKMAKKYDTYGVAFFNIPTLYWQMKKYDKAKEWYKKVLASDLHDFDETGSLMEPHTNYKHKSAIALAGLYQIDSNYAEVLSWINKADTTYRYWGFEGSATNVSLEQAFLLSWKVEVLLKLKKKEEAIQSIVTELICADNLRSFFRKSEDTLMALIDKKNFKMDFDKSLDGMTIQKIDDNNWKAYFMFQGLRYTITICKKFSDMNLPHYWSIYFVDEKQTVDKALVGSYIRRQNFYKRLQE